jgi:CheY-like chemotaxis protein
MNGKIDHPRRKEDSTAIRFIITMACKVLLRSNYCLSAEDVMSNKVNHDFNMKMLSHVINMSRFTLPSLTKQQTMGILVLDDDFDLSSLVKQVLQKHGFKDVFSFTDPLLALEHFRVNHKNYSIIISDVRMPIMNGLEFVIKARKIDSKIKILLMTAFEIDDKEFARVLPNPKIDGLIQKPASSAQILDAISKITRN